MGQARTINIPDHQLNSLAQHLIREQVLSWLKEKGCDLNEATLAET